MAKKSFDPFVLLLMPDPEPTTVTGGGTGQSTTDPYPCSFADWQTMFGQDMDDDEDIDMNDYMLWWDGQGFSMEAWNEFNPGVPFQPEPGGGL